MPLPSYDVIEAKAHELGFEKVGALSVPDLAGPLEVAGQRLRDWLSQGYHGEMQWMADKLDKRLSPESLMPGTQMILCVAMNYYTGPLEGDAKIARYAQGDDYHDVLKQRLKQLLVWLQSFEPTLEGRPLVDSAPILEKLLAVKAGMGWQGKNSNLITRDKGSWLFLGELLLNMPLLDAPQPTPLGDFCGSCRRCITACPTDAIVEPAVIDATRCISYWTIEYKGDSFPQTIQENLQGWLFGCDICQEVCPWNIKFQQETSESAFLPRPWNKQVNLTEIETLTPSQFKIRYRKSPIKRAKITGLQRNARALPPAPLKT